MKGFSKRLIRWYESNRRELPWRDTRDPYFVWLSEIILQQTRVDQGMSYYHKFTSLFPTVADLANAPEDTILKAWQGLGYYSRARNLHFTAKMVHLQFGDVFPKTSKELLQLKGVGAYTAAAIASFCYGERSAVIDGNVIRVLSRLFAIEHAADTKEGKKQIAELAERLIDKEDPGTYNQAVMEFGAILCTPKKPACAECPFAGECLALAAKAVDKFPLQTKRVVVKNVRMNYFFLRENHFTYIRKRSNNGIWKGLYDFPESGDQEKPEEAIAFFQQSFANDQELNVSDVSSEYTHVLTHRKINARFYEVELKTNLKETPEDWIKIKLSKLSEYGIPRLIDKYLSDRKILE